MTIAEDIRVFSRGIQFSKANAVAPNAVMSMSGQMNSHPMIGKKAVSSRITEARTNPLKAENLLWLVSLVPK